MKQLLTHIFYSFQVQLLILHLKRHQILLMFWVVLFLIISNSFGKEFGLPYLFLDPEYLGKVNFKSFFLLGAGLGGFTMTWNISTYVINSHRFPFLATFSKPFTMYCLNNSLIPIVFMITYVIIAYDFQSQSEFLKGRSIVTNMLGVVAGFTSMVILVIAYFITTNKNIFLLFGSQTKPVKKIQKRVLTKENMLWENFRSKEDEYRVDVYLTPSFHVRHIRSVKHYDTEQLSKVFAQNHSNALVFMFFNFITLIGFGFLVDVPLFQIPAATSGLIAFSMLVSIAGITGYWFGKWQIVYFVLFLVGVNFLIQKQVIVNDNQAFGLNYTTEKSIYNISHLEQLSNPAKMDEDKINTINILKNWRRKTGRRKPKLVVLNYSGGGLSSAVYSMAIMQKADSLLGGNLMKHAVLMTGASGGMLGATYVRELELLRQQNQLDNWYTDSLVDKLGKDLLNPIIFSSTVNDVFYPWRKFEDGEHEYIKDRAYVWEQQLRENTGLFTNKRLLDYTSHENNAEIPILIFSPTIVNDERMLYISSQPLSYLMRPYNYDLKPDYVDIDAVDFQGMFGKQEADSLLITSAMRMNATYPYILPSVTLPSQPIMRVMDAGLRDNYGLETSTKFVNVFKHWIKRYTSGVVIVQIRAFEKNRPIKAYEQESLVDRFFNPISSIYQNMGYQQDYHHNQLVSYINVILNGKVDIVNFTYVPQKKESKASLSYHLTTKEKQDILNTVNSAEVDSSIQRLKVLLDLPE